MDISNYKIQIIKTPNLNFIAHEFCRSNSVRNDGPPEGHQTRSKHVGVIKKKFHLFQNLLFNDKIFQQSMLLA